MIDKIEIAIDFDGTCVTHEFPQIGQDIGAVPVLKELVENGHLLILYTMRSNRQNVTTKDPLIHCESGDYLTHAVEWFAKNDIPLHGIQSNPTQSQWTTSPKCYAQLYIDDAALGCPLVHGKHERPFVDWSAVRLQLQHLNLLKQ